MELKILNEVDAELLSRKEYKLELVYDRSPTPSNDAVRKKIAESLKAEESLVKVKQINQIFGSGKSNIICYIYKNIESYKKFEEILKKKKAEKKEAPKQEKK